MPLKMLVSLLVRPFNGFEILDIKVLAQLWKLMQIVN